MSIALNYEMKNFTFSSVPHNYPWAKTLKYNFFNAPTIDGNIVSLLIFLISSVILGIFKKFHSVKNNMFTLNNIFIWSFFYNIIRFIDVENKFKPLIHTLLYKISTGNNYESYFLSLTHILLYNLLTYTFNAVVLL